MEDQSARRRLRNADAILGVVIVLFGIACWLYSRQIPLAGDAGTLSARFVPELMAISFVLLGAVLAIRKSTRDVAIVARLLGERQRLLMAAAVAIYFLSFRIVDYRVGTFLFMAVAMWLMGSRRWIEIVVALAVSIGTYLVFRYGFTVLLPTWS